MLLRGADGFGSDATLHTDRRLSASESLPAVAIAIDEDERIAGALDELRDLASGCLTVIEPTTLLTAADVEREPRPGDPTAPVRLTLYGGRAVRSGGEAGYVRAVELLARAGIAGSSVLLAVDGTLHGTRRRARFFARNAAVPLMLVAIGEVAILRAALPKLVALLDEPVITLDSVAVCKASGGRLREPPEHDRVSRRSHQRLTVHVEEQAMHGGRPVHVELLRALRDAGAAGATVLRGVRGFYADREPFADRALSLRRNVPVLVTAVDVPARVKEWWPVLDAVTAEHGLVTSETVALA